MYTLLCAMVLMTQVAGQVIAVAVVLAVATLTDIATTNDDDGD